MPNKMKLEYPTKYSDTRGTEHSVFITDGESLKIKIRGIVFEGNFYELTPIAGQEENASKLFDLNEFGDLSGILDLTAGAKPPAYSLTVQIPIKIISHENNELDAIIDFSINPHQMDLVFEGKTYKFENPNFEYGLSPNYTKSLNINYIKCCINCKFSEYSPFGNQEYGDLMCFKKCKEEWAKIGYTGLKDTENWEKIDNRITTQEAYWCEEFKLKD